MKIEALYRSDVHTAGMFEALADVASRMSFNEVGALPVMDGGTLVGIITERDLARATADGADAGITPVESYMTSNPVTVDHDADCGQAAALMLQIGSRHLPVTEGGRMVGMVSARDLLAEQAWNQEVPA